MNIWRLVPLYSYRLKNGPLTNNIGIHRHTILESEAEVFANIVALVIKLELVTEAAQSD